MNYTFFQRLAALNPRAAAIYAQGGQYPSMSEEEVAHNTVVRDMCSEATTLFELYSIPAPATQKTNLKNASQAYHEAREAFVRKADELLQKISFEEAQALNEYLERRWRKIHARETAIVYASNHDAYLERRERRDAWDLVYQGDRHYFYVRLGTLSARNVELKVFEQPNRVVFFVTAPTVTAATEYVDGRWQPWREGVSLWEAIASNRQGDMIFTTCPEEKFFPSLLLGENLTRLPAVLGASGQEYSWVRKANLVAQHNPQKTSTALIYPYVVISPSEPHVVLEHEDHPPLQISRPAGASGDWVVEAAPVGGHTQYRPHGWGED